LKTNEPLSVAKQRAEELAVRKAEAVVESLATIATDKSVSARDRATAGSAVLRAAGFYGAKSELNEKELHEMTAAELAAEIDRLNRLRSAPTETEEGAGLFD
jgi:hypothetical protein